MKKVDIILIGFAALGLERMVNRVYDDVLYNIRTRYRNRYIPYYRDWYRDYGRYNYNREIKKD